MEDRHIIGEQDSHANTVAANGDSPTSNEAVVTVKKPHRVLHFSDGTWEENSEDDEPDGKQQNETSLIDPTTLTWLPWFGYQAMNMGSKSLEVCDYLGEKLAAFFGITTPKYQYVIDEYNRMMEEEKKAQKQMDVEMGAWVNSNSNQAESVDAQPRIEQTHISPSSAAN